jgi:hypothetical protein
MIYSKFEAIYLSPQFTFPQTLLQAGRGKVSINKCECAPIEHHVDMKSDTNPRFVTEHNTARGGQLLGKGARGA